MSNVAEPTELERALARPDLADLRTILREYYACCEWDKSHGQQGVADAPLIPSEIHECFDPDICLALSALAASEYDDPTFLGRLAAEPLENMFMFAADVAEETIQRVEREASSNARFRWMLRGIYLGQRLSRSFEARILAAAGLRATADDALPPRDIK